MRYTLLKLTFILCSSFTTFAQVPTSGLLAHYPFNGNALDASTNGNNGQVQGATLTTDRFGLSNSAYEFNGSSSYISTTFVPPIGTESRTFSFWAKTNKLYSKVGSVNDAPNQAPMTAFSYGSGGSGNTLGITFNGGCEGLGLDINGSVLTYSTKIVDSTWHHYAVLTDKANSGNLGSVAYYKDGKKLGTTCLSVLNGTFNTSNANPLIIGSFYNHLFRYFLGSLDDIRIYNRALTQNEIGILSAEGTCFKSIAVSDTLRISTILGFNEVPEDFKILKIYPNPSSGSITLEAGDATGNYNVKITNSLSQVVYTSVINKQKTVIGLSTLGSTGVYYLVIMDSGNKILDSKKLILE